jgi:uncharacterized protein (DUF433 family)
VFLYFETGGNKMNQYISVNPRVCNGKPVISGTRIPVTVILDQLAEDGSIKEVLKKYPELTASAALRYCHAIIEYTELEQQFA